MGISIKVKKIKERLNFLKKLYVEVHTAQAAYSMVLALYIGLMAVWWVYTA